MNSTNTPFGTKRFQRKTDQYIIKNAQPIGLKKTQTSLNPSLRESIIKPKIGLKPQIPQENPVYIHAKIGVPFDKIQRAISREEIDGRNLIKASSIPEGNLEDFVRKNKYEELQKKYELLLKKHEESKHRQKHFEMNYIKEKKLADELSIENNKLKAKIRELEEKNKDLLASQHSGNLDHDNPNFEEHKTDNSDIRSLRLAMRLEAENVLLNQLSQIAALQMLLERPEGQNLGTEYGHQDNINPDNMTYEELLQLEERMGKVSKGLSIEEIKKIPKKKYYKSPNKPEETCSICYCEFETGTKIRKLNCNHDYHSKCIKKWLLNEKTCPICKKEVETS